MNQILFLDLQIHAYKPSRARSLNHLKLMFIYANYWRWSTWRSSGGNVHVYMIMFITLHDSCNKTFLFVCVIDSLCGKAESDELALFIMGKMSLLFLCLYQVVHRPFEHLHWPCYLLQSYFVEGCGIIPIFDIVLLLYEVWTKRYF